MKGRYTMTTELIMKDFGTYKNFSGIYSFVENCKIQKYIYLVLGINLTKNEEFYSNGATAKVIFNYHEHKEIRLFNTFDEFNSIDKETFMAKLDEAKEQIDTTVNDEVDMWLKDKFTMDDNLKNLFWKYILDGRRKMIDETKRMTLKKIA